MTGSRTEPPALCDYCKLVIKRTPEDRVTVRVTENAPPEERHYHRLCWEKVRSDDVVERGRYWR